MSKDIVERLRDVENYDAEITRYEAADEIERLRALITAWITAWAEAQSALDNASWDESKQLHAFAKDEAALRKAVGR